MEVLRDGLTVFEVAERYGISRQSVHGLLRRYWTSGLDGAGRPLASTSPPRLSSFYRALAGSGLIPAPPPPTNEASCRRWTTPADAAVAGRHGGIWLVDGRELKP